MRTNLTATRAAFAMTLATLAGCVSSSEQPPIPAGLDAGGLVGFDASVPVGARDAAPPSHDACVSATGAVCIPVDAGADASLPDAGPADTGADTTIPDAAIDDAGSPDASVGDAEVDAAVVDCTTSGPNQHFVLGTYTQPVTMTGKVASRVLTPATANDAYLAHFDPTHCFDWAARVTGAFAQRLAVDAANGAVYVAFTAVSDPVTFYDASDAAVATFASTAPRGTDLKGQDVLLARYSTSGQFVWAKRMGVDVSGLGSAAPRVTEVAIAGNQVRLGGTLYQATTSASSPSHPIVFGPGEANEQTITMPDNFTTGYTALFDAATGAYAAKSAYTFHASPTAQAKQVYLDAVHSGAPVRSGVDAGAAAGEYAVGVWVPASAGTSITFGAETATPTTVATNAQSEPVFARFGADGKLAWTRQVHATGGVSATAMLASGGAVWLGEIQTTAGSSVVFEDGASGTSITVGANDMFLVRYSAIGAVDWLKKISMPSITYGPPDIVVDEANDALYAVAGAVSGAVFGPGEATQTTFTFDTSLGQSAAGFLARYKLSTGGFEWVRGVAEGQSGLFQNNLQIVGGEITVGALVDKQTTFDFGGANATTVGDGAGFYYGVARYAGNGGFLGYGEFVRYPQIFFGGSPIEVVSVP